MAAFRFPLDKVLEHRKESERKSAQGLARARGEADAARRAKADLEAVREAGRTRLAEAHGSGGAVGHLQNLAYVLGQVEEQIEDADAVCQHADEQVVESIKSFQHAVQQRRTIEGLRERRLGEWRDAEVRDERKAMDDVALMRHGRPDPGSTGGGA